MEFRRVLFRSRRRAIPAGRAAQATILAGSDRIVAAIIHSLLANALKSLPGIYLDQDFEGLSTAFHPHPCIDRPILWSPAYCSVLGMTKRVRMHISQDTIFSNQSPSEIGRASCRERVWQYV